MGKRKQTAAGRKKQLQRNRDKFKRESEELKKLAETGELDTSPDALSKMSNSVAKRATTNATRLTSALAKKRFVEQVNENVDRLFAAQLTLALGSSKLYCVTIQKNGSRVTEAIDDVHTIIAYLNDPEGYKRDSTANEVWFISDKDPENKAIVSLLDRSMGSPKQELLINDESGIFVKDRLKIEVVQPVDLDIQEGEIIEAEVVEEQKQMDAQEESEAEDISESETEGKISLEESNSMARTITTETLPNSQTVDGPILEHPTQSTSVGIKLTRL